MIKRKGENFLAEKNIVTINALTLSFDIPEGIHRPIRGLNLEVLEGEVLVVLGESGAGKSLLAKAIMGILPSEAKITQGSISNVYGFEQMAMVLQDPKKLLDPSMTIGKQIIESLKYAGVDKREWKRRALELLEEVSMDDPKMRFSQYAHELSGGLAQRAVLAIALAKKPKLLLADEPTTALDEGNEEKIIRLLMDLTKKNHMTTILITHSLKVAMEAADRIAVMYGGKVIEFGKKDEVLKNPIHPYTKALILAANLISDGDGNLISINGNGPSPCDITIGDAFAKRNPKALVIDFLEEPPMMRVTKSHYAATWLLDQRYDEYRESKSSRFIV